MHEIERKEPGLPAVTAELACIEWRVEQWVALQEREAALKEREAALRELEAKLKAREERLAGLEAAADRVA